MKLPIYFDYAATTPVDPRVAEKMCSYLTAEGHFANPASSHSLGREAARAIEQAREQTAHLLNADSEEIIWTSGATEANNLAIKGIAHFYRHKGQHIVTSLIEHEAVLESCRQLEREGFTVTYLQPQKTGLITLDQLTAALRPETILVSLMHVNNELGVIHDIAAFGQLLKAKNIFFHVDAAQSVGKISLDLQKIPVDLLAFSAHKIYGPKGIGALYLRKSAKMGLQTQMHGGGQERGLRSGTLATHQIVGLGEALHIAKQEMDTETKRIKELRDFLWVELQKIGDLRLNGDIHQQIPNILNMAFLGVDGLKLLPAINDLAISTGSACHSSTLEPSRVLKTIGLNNDLAQASLRFSLGRYTTKEEIDYAIYKLQKVIPVLREIWEVS